MRLKSDGLNSQVILPAGPNRLKASSHSGKLSMVGTDNKNFSLSCELWVGTNDFNRTKKNFLVRSNPWIIVETSL